MFQIRTVQWVRFRRLTSRVLADWKGEALSANPDDASTTGSNATEARGSKDAMRLSSVREIEDFPLAARIRRILATS